MSTFWTWWPQQWGVRWNPPLTPKSWSIIWPAILEKWYFLPKRKNTDNFVKILFLKRHVKTLRSLEKYFKICLFLQQLCTLFLTLILLWVELANPSCPRMSNLMLVKAHSNAQSHDFVTKIYSNIHHKMQSFWVFS